MSRQVILFVLLGLALALFIRGRWRYDIVAILVLLTATVCGIVPGSEAFYGFGDPAVVTVAAVFVVSRGLQESGVAHVLTQWVLRIYPSTAAQATALVVLVTTFSAFMNNIGALALFLPVAIRLARKAHLSPSLLLMPLAFGSLLGGMTTLIGTPPNIIVSDFRAQAGSAPFGIFDFAPVGVSVAGVGVLLLCLIGRHLVPRRAAPPSREELFDIGTYVSEVRVSPGSPLIGKTIREVGWATDTEVLVLSLVRDGTASPAPLTSEVLHAGDLLIVEANPRTLRLLIHAAGFEFVGEQELVEELLGSEEVSVVEAVVAPASPMIRQTARSLELRWRHAVNLLAVARQGHRLRGRLGNIRFLAGDVLLLQARTGTVRETLHALGCLPLAGRGIRFGPPHQVFFSAAVCSTAVAATAVGFLPVQISLAGAAVVLVLARVISLQDAYESIDWSILVLLGAMIPVGQAMESTGAATSVASYVLRIGGGPHPVATLVLLLVASMLLSNVMNNAATAVVMAPIAVSLAHEVGASVDPFLMAVAIGSTAAFLTPIGHQSNTLVMGPGGYRFGDYWRLGLPVSVTVVIVAVPLLLWWWPLTTSAP